MRRLNNVLLLGVLCLVGCTHGPGLSERTSRASLDELPRDCDAVLATADSLSIGAIEGTDDFLVESDRGSCITDEDSLVDGLKRHREPAVASRVADAISRVKADPTPHPDLNVDGVRADPSPHPDLNVDGVRADPSPHPDVNSGDTHSVEVVVWVIFVGKGDALDDDDHGPARPAAPTPQPSSMSSGTNANKSQG